jgi:hypothetical protein
MRSRVLLCAIAAVAVAATTLTLPKAAQAGAYPGNKCVAAKLKAASSNCKAVLGAWSKFVGGGGTDTAGRDATLGKAAGKLTSAWDKAEASAAKKEVDCADMTISDAVAQTTINASVTSIVNDVLAGLTLSNKDDAKCGAALVKAAASQCAALLKSESGYIAKLAAGKTKRDAANAKADGKLSSSVAKALGGGSCPSGATLGSLDTAVDGLTASLITDTTISPNVDDTQFTTITPGNQSYEGSQLKPTCAFSTPYHYFVKRGSVNKLVMYYQGGGACWDFNTCGLLGIFDKDVNPTGSDNPNNTTTGFGDLTNPNNPFKDWNIVFVSYCTGDIHFGDANANYGGVATNTFHKGWHNARTAEKFAREHFVNPDEIFVTGSSAGAYGAFFNAPLHHAVWPDSKFTVLADAGNGVITPSFLTDNFPTWNFEVHLPPYIPGLVEAIQDGTGIPAYTAAVAAYFPNTAWGHYTSSYDGGTGGQTGFYNVMQNLGDVLAWPSWWNASCAWNTVMRSQAIASAAGAPSNYRYYIGTGSRHTMYGSNKVYTDVTGGVPTIVDWVNSMRARDGGWTNVECSSDCGKLLPGDPQPGSLPTPPFSMVGPDVVITCP